MVKHNGLSFKYFINEDLKTNDKGQYPVYVQLWYKGVNTKMSLKNFILQYPFEDLVKGYLDKDEIISFENSQEGKYYSQKIIKFYDYIKNSDIEDKDILKCFKIYIDKLNMLYVDFLGGIIMHYNSSVKNINEWELSSIDRNRLKKLSLFYFASTGGKATIHHFISNRETHDNFMGIERVFFCLNINDISTDELYDEFERHVNDFISIGAIKEYLKTKNYIPKNII